ncbi:putative glycosyltransferase family 2 protein [Neofusicoccum parvum]|uniref:Glycosyltransferase family 2 protein n=1 Tax=Neofusicoccum parvum TaxID=310453 RepID=A0ACB5SMK2_9PEZI|nr:putative glycosyltransferase family 2 protein [Neofusicoccum parvum]
MIIPCYNETQEELTAALDSLVDQKNIDEHQKVVMIICDGRARGKGMEKTTAQYLLEDILPMDAGSSRKTIEKAYIAWDQQSMDVTVQKGSYRGMPYCCVVKHQNQGKRDSLIVLRSFLYKYNIRHERPESIFKPEFFAEMATFLAGAGMDHVDDLIGMDADTVFEDICVSELLKQARLPNTLGVCGLVAVDFKGEKWGGLWKLYQTCDYALSQGLRRLHQSIVTNCVTCLPGCCQLFRVCEESCGDHIMLDRFGYHPTPTDDIVKQIRANASEDGNHVCHMLSAYSHAGWKTRQAIRARAFTDVPQSWSVFLSQRRRWSLGTTANELLLIRESGIHWFERIIAFSNCLTWLLSISIAVAATSFYIRGVAPRWISYALLGIVLTRVVYYILMVFWFPRTSRERKQYLLGLFGYLIVGRLVSALILLYAMYYIDSFGWGKTRKVVSEASAPSGNLEPIRDEEASLGMEKRTQPTTKVLDLQGDSSSSSS